MNSNAVSFNDDQRAAGFVVNSLGECIRTKDGKDDWLPEMGSLDISELSQRLELSPGVWPSKEEIRYEWDRRAHQWLRRHELEFYKHVIGLQKRIVDDGRVRIWGKMDPDRTWHVRLVTEFKELSDNVDFWRRAELAVSRLQESFSGKVELYTLVEQEQVEHSYTQDGSGKKVPGSDRYGKNHGKMMRQVEIAMDLGRTSLKTAVGRAKTAKEQLTTATEDLWREAGVAVC